MKRTVLVAVLLGAAGAVCAQGRDNLPAVGQGDPVAGLVQAMQAAEERLRSVVIEMSTRGVLPGGEEVTTRGSLRVLRGEQSAVHAKFQFEFGSGIRGRSESVQTKAGIVLFEDDPALGETFVQIDPKIVADLEWAGAVLQRDDLPGMPPLAAGDAPERRASSPLGSALLAAMQRQFDLKVDARTERGGEPGRWYTGRRRGGVGSDAADAPAADAVSLFVRAADLALLELELRQGDTVLQRLVVDRLVVDPPLEPSSFVIEVPRQRPRPVQQVPPLWETIEQAVRRAEAKSPDGVVRPSRR